MRTTVLAVVVMLLVASPASAETLAGPILVGPQEANVRAAGSLATRLVVGNVAHEFGRLRPVTRRRDRVGVADLAASPRRVALVREVTVERPPQPPCATVCQAMPVPSARPRFFEAWSAVPGKRPRLLIRRTPEDACAGRLAPMAVEVGGSDVVLLETDAAVFCGHATERSRIVAVDPAGARRVITEGGVEAGAPLDFAVDGDWIAWRTDGAIDVARLSTGRVVYSVPPAHKYDVDAGGRLAVLKEGRSRHRCGPESTVETSRLFVADPTRPHPRDTGLEAAPEALAISRGRVLAYRLGGRCRERVELSAHDLTTGANRYVPRTCRFSFGADLHSAWDGRRAALACGVVVPRRR